MTSNNNSAVAERLTPLHALHIELGARMMPFAGFSMPVQYAGGIKHEHLHTRAAAGLFDVSHMGQLSISAPASALEALVPADIVALANMRQRYSLLTNDAGGIIDDLMITRLDGKFFVVVNAAFRSKVGEYLKDALGRSASVVMYEERALLALQGPAAVDVLAAMDPALTALPFMAARECTLDALPVVVNRCGYTGEDGFEISVAAEHATALARRLLDDPRVEPVGLGARDSLRLEAGFCLSGSDIGPSITPAQAVLGWTIARKYRDGTATAKFPGAAVILAELTNGAAQLRVGLRPLGRAPLRADMRLADDSGNDVGSVSSGSFGPSVKRPVAMAYVSARSAVSGSKLTTSIRGRTHEVEVCHLPFVPHRYYRST